MTTATSSGEWVKDEELTARVLAVMSSGDFPVERYAQVFDRRFLRGEELSREVASYLFSGFRESELEVVGMKSMTGRIAGLWNLRKLIWGGVKDLGTVFPWNYVHNDYLLEDYVLVMNPKTARAFGATKEVMKYVEEYDGLKHHDSQFVWEEYGLPSSLFGMRLIVEDTFTISSDQSGNVSAEEYVVPDGELYQLIATERPDLPSHLFRYSAAIAVESFYVERNGNECRFRDAYSLLFDGKGARRFQVKM